jgi:hypothetical protein
MVSTKPLTKTIWGVTLWIRGHKNHLHGIPDLRSKLIEDTGKGSHMDWAYIRTIRVAKEDKRQISVRLSAQVV